LLQTIKYVLGVLLGLVPSAFLILIAETPSPTLNIVVMVLAVMGVALGVVYASPYVSNRRVNRTLLAFFLSNILPHSVLMSLLDDEDEDDDDEEFELIPQRKKSKPLNSKRYSRGDAPRLLKDFQKLHIYKVEELPSQQLTQEDRSRAGIIKAKADLSLATACGVEVGDLLLDVDEQIDGHEMDWDGFYNPSSKIKLRFHSPSTGRTWVVTATGAPLGVRIEPTDEAIAKSLRSGNVDYEMLEILWEREEWSLLQQAAAPISEDMSDMLQPIGSLYVGIARCELGYPSGAELLESYAQNHFNDFTMNLAAMCLAHLGAFTCIKQDAERGHELLYRAAQLYSHPKILDLVERHTGNRPPANDGEAPQVGRRWDVDFTLASADRGGGRVSLEEAINNLSERQLLPVCFLGDYRSNGPYRRFLFRFRKAAIFFPHFFGPLIAVTLTRQLPNPPSQAVEMELHDQGIALHVQWDRTGEVHAEVKPEGSPYILFVNRDRVVVGSHFLDEIETWQLIESQVNT
jgi:hypothetical protein